VVLRIRFCGSDSDRTPSRAPVLGPNYIGPSDHSPVLVILLTSSSSDALLMKRIPRLDPGRVTVQVSSRGSQLYIVPTETFLYSAA
jgi:hypothetical protein